jgi:hypothetical protein
MPDQNPIKKPARAKPLKSLAQNSLKSRKPAQNQNPIKSSNQPRLPAHILGGSVGFEFAGAD